MKGYKVTDSEMQCRGYQFEIGKTETKSILDQVLNSEPEYTAGEIVDGIDFDDKPFYSATYTGWESMDGGFVCEILIGHIFKAKEIRKHNPDCVYHEIAEEIISENDWAELPNGTVYYVHEVKQMLITAAKEGEKLNKK